MTLKQNDRPQEGAGPAIFTPEKRPMTPKLPHNYSEPLWKRNLGKTVKQKKIGEVSRAKGGRY